MDANFWHQKWEKNEIAFHDSKANVLLVEYFDRLSLQKGDRIFLPLCGKTLDIHWLLSQGYRVAGAELSQIAIEQLFQELGISPKINRVGQIVHYEAEHLDIFVGDIFRITEEQLGKVNAIYDRAALVALPNELRTRYADHLIGITKKAPQLLICYEYDQSREQGPPFSIGEDLVRKYYQDAYSIKALVSKDVPGGLRGKTPAKENAWLLERID